MLKSNSEDKHLELKDVPHNRNIPPHLQRVCGGRVGESVKGVLNKAES